jgi:hypothetical protein
MKPPDSDAALAAFELIGRTGATQCKVGYLHDDVPSEQAGWYAEAQYRGARILVEDFASPDHAVDALARRVLTGAQCMHCDRVIVLDGGDFDAVISQDRLTVDGRPWPPPTVAAGPCVWRRDGRHWVGCRAAAA